MLTMVAMSGNSSVRIPTGNLKRLSPSPRSRILFRDHFAGGTVQCIGDIHQDSMFFHGSLAVFVEQKVEGFGESSLTSWRK